MSTKKQADKVAAMLGKAQAVVRPSNLPDEELTKPEIRQSTDTGNREAGKPENRDGVNIGVKVPRTIAHWWTAQGKLKRRSVADVIRAALVAEYGLPDGFTEEDVYPETRKTGFPGK